MKGLACGLLLLCACEWRVVDAIGGPGRPGTGALCEIPYVDPRQQTDLRPGDRSHWHQPWRAWTETLPARRMREALGITWARNEPDRQRRLELIAASGMARVYVSIDWESIDFDQPDRFQADDQAQIRAWLALVKASGLRPHVMIQGHFGRPCPARDLTVRVTATAAAGARQLKIDPAALPQIVLGRSGLFISDGAAATLFTAAAPDGTVTLSRPLTAELRAGATPRVTVLRFAPFQRPLRPDGTPNPVFEETMRGWEMFLQAVANELRPMMGNNWDLELYNEIGHSRFLDANNYYEAPIDKGPGAPYDAVSRALVERSLAFVRNPAQGLSGVRVISGIANSRWREEGAGTMPPGATLSRHVSLGGLRFPSPTSPGEIERSLRPDGQLNGALGMGGAWTEAFTPQYRAVFPERSLVPLLPPRTIFPDLSLLPSMDTFGRPRGRQSRPDGQEVPVWISAFSLNPDGLSFDLANADTPDELALQWRFKAKSSLRAAAAYVGKGAEGFIFYSPNGGVLQLFDSNDQLTGGPVFQALRRFLDAFAGPPQLSSPRAIALETVASCTQGTQFDGGAGVPPLYNGEVVAFFPFQSDQDRFVVPVYVMTRDLGRNYRPNAVGDPTRYDLPPERFTLTLSGLRSAAPQMALLDPLSGMTTPVQGTSRGGGRVSIDIELRDWPKLLTIVDR